MVVLADFFSVRLSSDAAAAIHHIISHFCTVVVGDGNILHSPYESISVWISQRARERESLPGLRRMRPTCKRPFGGLLTRIFCLQCSASEFIRVTCGDTHWVSKDSD